jgi:hypothetical protein
VQFSTASLPKPEITNTKQVCPCGGEVSVSNLRIYSIASDRTVPQYRENHFSTSPFLCITNHYMLQLVRDTDSIVKQSTNKNKCIKKKRFREKKNLFPVQGSITRSSDIHSLEWPVREQLQTIRNLRHHGRSQTDKKKNEQVTTVLSLPHSSRQDQRLHRGNQRATIGITARTEVCFIF